ncbi:hypothetical protein B0O99DRAFT_597735 [Bisporella sp. PMI_857]|nr:hypothetical protein B0O99DRAFT_597735 [Bisporella sp. PMI_857]
MADTPLRNRGGISYDVKSIGGTVHNGTNNATHSANVNVTFASPQEAGEKFFDEGVLLSKKASSINHYSKYGQPVPANYGSTPMCQFRYQEEILIAYLSSQNRASLDRGTLASEAGKIIKARWEKRGIWSNHWEDRPGWQWKHEDLPESCSEKDKLEVPSRPYHQFNQQLEQERLRMINTGGKWDMASPDINTMAADAVKNSWIHQKIWNDQWGTHPGMKWMSSGIC